MEWPIADEQKPIYISAKKQTMFGEFLDTLFPARTTRRRIRDLYQKSFYHQLKIQHIMELYDELKSEIADLGTTLTRIDADVTKLANSIPVTGGLTEDQAQSLKTDLLAILSQAKTIDARTPNDGDAAAQPEQPAQSAPTSAAPQQ
jgi:hypothetical protein